MKMEIPVVTEEAGVVRRITVTEGQVVQQGDLIAELD
jgi:biotin carboxyl carrier protein